MNGDGITRRPLLSRLILLPVLLSFIAGGAATAQNGDLDERAATLRQEVRHMIIAARDEVFPALVNIEVITVNYYGGQERKGGSIGSGTIISPEGYVVTNYHVTDNGEEYLVRLADKREVPARLVGDDPLTDLAVLQIDLEALPGDKNLPVAHFGDSNELQTGDYVLAMGSPLALSRSVTLGIVSNTERVLASAGSELEDMEIDAGQRTGLFTRWIQHDAQIHHGNSGGPLVNMKGEIVGVNELGMGAGQGFAIPSNLAEEVVAALIADGEVIRSDVGLSLRTIQDTGLEAGAVVNAVIADSPADEAGIQPGDVLLTIDGDPITVRFVEQLPPLLKRLASVPVGTTMTLGCSRDGEPYEAQLTTVKLQRDVGDETVFRAWGFTAMQITERMARERRLDSTEGAIVSGVRSGGSAQLAEPSLRPGDVIHAIDGAAIDNLVALVEHYKRVMEMDPLPKFLLFEFERAGKNHITLVKPKPDRDQDPPRELPKAWIGVATQPVLQKLAERLELGDVTGHRITRVYPRTTAAETDLQVGDVIVAVNDQSVQPKTVQDAGMFSRLVRRLDIGSTATLSVMRDGAQREIDVKTERTHIEPGEARRDRNRDFDLIVREVTFFDRDAQQWSEDTDGVIVEAVEPGGWANRAGVRPGDLIQRINDAEVTGLPAYRTIMDSIAAEEPERVVFVVLRGVRTSFLFVEPDWTPDTEEETAAEATAGSQTQESQS